MQLIISCGVTTAEPVEEIRVTCVSSSAATNPSALALAVNRHHLHAVQFTVLGSNWPITATGSAQPIIRDEAQGLTHSRGPCLQISLLCSQARTDLELRRSIGALSLLLR